jgi:hypothetical protein
MLYEDEGGSHGGGRDKELSHMPVIVLRANAVPMGEAAGKVAAKAASKGLLPQPVSL